MGAVLGSNKGGELVRNHEDLAVGQCGQVSSADPAGGNEEDGYEDLEVYLKNGNATNGFLGECDAFKLSGYGWVFADDGAFHREFEG